MTIEMTIEMTTTLPTLEELVLVPATPEQVTLIIAWQHKLWSYGGKDLKGFTQQQRELFSLPWARDRRLIHWVLVKKGDYAGEIYSTCESRRRDALNKPAGSSRIEPGYCYGISSVQTPVQFRRRGYAGHMLRLLHLRLSPPTSYESLPAPYNVAPPALAAEYSSMLPPATASFLWSDVGRHYYQTVTIPTAGAAQRPGWIVSPGTGDSAIRWKPAARIQGQQTWSWIYYHELDDVAASVAADVKAQLESRPVDTISIITTDPASVGLLQSVLEEARHKDWRQEPYTEPIGARIPRPDGSTLILLFAPRFFGKGELILTLAHNVEAGDVDKITEVLSAALEITNCHSVEAWALNQSVTKAFIQHGATHETRKEVDGHLLAVAVYAEGWQWENGQAYLWC